MTLDKSFHCRYSGNMQETLKGVETVRHEKDDGEDVSNGTSNSASSGNIRKVDDNER